MFTIKHIEKDGYEAVRTARTVDFVPQSADCEYATVTAYDVPGAGDYLPFVSGQVYVMNEYGKTIANYNLDALNRNRQQELPR